MSPAIDPGPRLQPPPAWPAVVGVICVVLGAGGTLFNLCGGVLSPFGPHFFRSLSQMPGQDKAFLEAHSLVMEKHMVVSVAGSLASMAVSILLLVGGIGLLKRRTWCVKTLNVWSTVRLVLVLAGTIVGLIISADTTKAMEGVTGQSGAASFMPIGVLQVVGMIFGFLWACALPIFLLIWLRRTSVKAEVATWRQIGSSPLPRRGGSST